MVWKTAASFNPRPTAHGVQTAAIHRQDSIGDITRYARSQKDNRGMIGTLMTNGLVDDETQKNDLVREVLKVTHEMPNTFSTGSTFSLTGAR